MNLLSSGAKKESVISSRPRLNSIIGLREEVKMEELLNKFKDALMYILTESNRHPDDSVRDIINEAMLYQKLPILVNQDWEVIMDAKPDGPTNTQSNQSFKADRQHSPCMFAECVTGGPCEADCTQYEPAA